MRVELLHGDIRQNINSSDADSILGMKMMFSGNIYAALNKSDDRTAADLALLCEAMQQGTLWIYNSPMSDADIEEMQKVIE